MPYHDIIVSLPGLSTSVIPQIVSFTFVIPQIVLFTIVIPQIVFPLSGASRETVQSYDFGSYECRALNTAGPSKDNFVMQVNVICKCHTILLDSFRAACQYTILYKLSLCSCTRACGIRQDGCRRWYFWSRSVRGAELPSGHQGHYISQ